MSRMKFLKTLWTTAWINFGGFLRHEFASIFYKTFAGSTKTIANNGEAIKSPSGASKATARQEDTWAQGNVHWRQTPLFHSTKQKLNVDTVTEKHALPPKHFDGSHRKV